MAIYCYKNEETNTVLDVEMSITEEHPKTLEHEGKIFTRHMGAEKRSIHIPYQWGSGNNSMLRQDKGPSGKRKFF